MFALDIALETLEGQTSLSRGVNQGKMVSWRPRDDEEFEFDTDEAFHDIHRSDEWLRMSLEDTCKQIEATLVNIASKGMKDDEEANVGE